MTDATATVVSARLRSEATILGTLDNLDGDRADGIRLPVGFGDVILRDVQVRISDITTLATLSDVHGCGLVLVDANGEFKAPVGVEFWKQVYGGATTKQVQAFFPVRDIIWYSGELLRILFEEVDTDATPTADLAVICRVIRIRSS